MLICNYQSTTRLPLSQDIYIGVFWSYRFATLPATTVCHTSNKSHSLYYFTYIVCHLFTSTGFETVIKCIILCCGVWHKSPDVQHQTHVMPLRVTDSQSRCLGCNLITNIQIVFYGCYFLTLYSNVNTCYYWQRLFKHVYKCNCWCNGVFSIILFKY